jgi:hypothetical protein
MQWVNRLKKLERFLATKHSSVDTGFRVAGKSRSEVFAEMLVHLFSRLEQLPGMAAAMVDASRSTEALPPETPEGMEKWVGAIRVYERQNPGLAGRVLDAMANGAEALTEETLFPAGRPADEETYYTRQGNRFYFPLDSPS